MDSLATVPVEEIKMFKNDSPPKKDSTVVVESDESILETKTRKLKKKEKGF